MASERGAESYILQNDVQHSLNSSSYSRRRCCQHNTIRINLIRVVNVPYGLSLALKCTCGFDSACCRHLIEFLFYTRNRWSVCEKMDFIIICLSHCLSTATNFESPAIDLCERIFQYFSFFLVLFLSKVQHWSQIICAESNHSRRQQINEIA